LASIPAYQAPTAEPIRAMATTNPVMPEPRPKWVLMESTAPLMTEVSKPKRKPPTAAAIEIPDGALRRRYRPHDVRHLRQTVCYRP